MKKSILVLIIFLISFLQINISHSASLDKKLYKYVNITNIQLKKDYGENVYKKIVSIFVQYRYDKNKESLNKLKKILKEKIQVLNNKKILSTSEKKKSNLYKNLYFRTILLLEYNL